MHLTPDQPEFFFDDALIADTRSLQRHWLPASIYPDPVVTRDRAWEGRNLVLYGTILPDPAGGWRLYYSSFNPTDDLPRTVMLARSNDGIFWEKPELGSVDFRGSSANNIVFAQPGTGIDSPSVAYDPSDEKPYKMISFQYAQGTQSWSKGWGMHVATSTDGLRWDVEPGGPHLVAGDRSNIMTSKVDGKWVLYTRHRDMGTQVGVRAVYRSESGDFLKWSEPRLVLKPDLIDPPDMQFYGMPVFRRHGWFIGLLEHWRSDLDVLEVHLAFSRDGISWQRPAPRTPFIASTYPWNKTWSTCASNGPIILNEQMLFYFGGRWASHHWDTARQHGAIGYASIGLDQFCALEAASGGRITTNPLTWPGGELILNADCRQSFQSHPGHVNGKIEIEILDEHGAPLPDWSSNNKCTFAANTHARGNIYQPPARWGDRSLDALKGQTLRLRMTLTHARLFTIEARTS